MIMSRKIRFRGKRTDNGKWIYGDLIHDKAITGTGLRDRVRIGKYEVIPETVGQFTGLTDKNGKEIYEGDVLEFETKQGFGIPFKGKIRFKIDFGEFIVKNDSFYEFIGFHTDGGSIKYKLSYGCEVVGIVHDNPELLIPVPFSELNKEATINHEND
jgi:uncharacterized phage protein (TIGR01671 family)